MIDVQNRTPTPGKEGNVTITPETGSPITGILAMADEATNPGTPWNRQTGRLLQADIRQYPIAAGTTVVAGDVVNVRREDIPVGDAVGELPVGSEIQLNENGVPVPYIIVHQGNPDASMYDASCAGTWILRKEPKETAKFNPNSQYSTIADAPIWQTIAGYISEFADDVQSSLKNVKIPYCPGNGSELINAGANGLSCTGFLLSALEIGLSGTSSGFPADGVKLDYFIQGGSADANARRATSYTYWTRSPLLDDSHIGNYRELVWASTQSGGVTNGSVSINTYGIRPAYILDPTFHPSGSILGPVSITKAAEGRPNTEISLESYGAAFTSVLKLNAQQSVVFTAYPNNNSQAATCHLVDNATGVKIQTVVLSGSASTQSVSLARLSDTQFFVACNRSGIISGYVGTVTSNSVSFGSPTTLVDTSGGYAAVALDESRVLFLYFTTGLMGQVLNISGNNIGLGISGTFSPGKTITNFSAVLLPDGPDGSKRVYINYATSLSTGEDTQVGIIATVTDSAVSFGEPADYLLNAGGTYSSLCADGDYVIVAAVISGTVRLVVVNTSGSSITPGAQTLTVGTSNCSYTALAKVGDLIILAGNIDGSGKAAALSRTGSTLTAGELYTFNAAATRYTSAAALTSAQFLVSYADGGNSNYPIDTILTVSGDQIAGSFVYNSMDAIALEGGAAGDTIEVIFSGETAVPWVTEGQEITSEGVYGFGAVDGVLSVIPWWNKNAGVRLATGSYVGTGTSGSGNLNMITFPEGFTPQLVIIQAISGGTTAGLLVLPVKDDNTSAYVPSTGSSGGGSAAWNVYGVTTSFNHQYNRIGWYANYGGAANQLNVSGATYKWIAIG